MVVGFAGSSGGSDGFYISPGAFAIAGGLAGGAAGGVLGVVFSISSKKYKVNGQENKYVKMQNKINNRLTKKKRAA